MEQPRSAAPGRWERLYPGLDLNNLLGTFEYPDFPMTPGDFSIRQGQHIPGEALHDYLVKYTQHFGFNKYIHFKSKATKPLYDDQVSAHLVRRRRMKTSTEVAL